MTPIAAPETPPIGADIRDAARLLGQGNTDAALALLAPLLADDAAVPPRFVLGMAAWRNCRLDWAIALLRECHERWPMDGTVAETLASLHAQSGNLVDSVYMAKLGTALGSGSPLDELLPPGFPSFERALAAIRERPLLVQARHNLGAGKLDEAIVQAQQHVALDGGDSDGVAFCATLLLRAGQAAAAVATMSTIEAAAAAAAPTASLYARALAGVGEAAASRDWHDRACVATPDDAAIAAARLADAIWFEADPRRIAAAGAAWVERFCPPPRPRSWRAPENKLVIAYLVPALADPRDAAAVAAVARAHDRARVKVLGYGAGAESWLENAALGGAFDTWRDIAALDAATLARFFARDGVDVVIDASGLSAPQTLMALAQLDGAIRVAWLGNTASLGAPIYDAAITASSAGAAGAWAIAGAYPVCRPTRQVARPGRIIIQFGADVRLAQMDAETVAMWSALLHAAPEARLLLRTGDAGSGAVDRLVARFGRALAARVDLVGAERVEEFYALVDVALAPRRGVSPRLAAEALACGVPPVALAGPASVEPYSRFLRDLGFGDALVAADAAGYVERVLALSCSDAARAEVGARMAAVDCGAASLARMVEERSLAMLRGAAAA